MQATENIGKTMDDQKPKKKQFHQYAALPYVVRDGELQIFLVTSRQSGRWIIPKGWAEKGRKGYEVAANEAYEEAGLIGKVVHKRIACFEYIKRIDESQTLACTVGVYPMAVEQILSEWPEKDQRQRELMSPGQAAMRVSDAGLIQLMLDLTDFGEMPEKSAKPAKIRFR
jgi:8-oxo-dGTP pyrophosphatase MutT (NUDIX family)